MFNQDRIESIRSYFEKTRRWPELVEFRKLQPEMPAIKNLFYGDSITESWQLHEFFPNHSIINRGLSGDNVHGLYSRLEEDVFPYAPARVFMLAGINGIDEELQVITSCLQELARLMQARGIEVFLSSILPLGNPEVNNRYQYSDKVVEINRITKAWAQENDCGFLDYHSKLKNEAGDIEVRYAQEDGLHVTFDGYRLMSEIVRPHLL